MSVETVVMLHIVFCDTFFFEYLMKTSKKEEHFIKIETFSNNISFYYYFLFI